MSSPTPFAGYKPPSPTPLSPPLSLAGSSAPPTGPSVLSSSLPTPLQQPSDAARYASSSVAAPMVHFDPLADNSDEDDDDEDGRSKKKRKGANGASAGAAGDSREGAGAAGDEEKDKGRRKIEIEYIHKKEKRHITFSKRKAGIMKKAYELATLTGTQVLLLVVSETGIVYTFTTVKFQPLVGAGPGGNPSEGQRLIQACLAVDPNDGSDYISPPPDGPLLPLPPSAINRPFEPNSNVHGGQIALRTRAHRPGGSHRNKPRPAAIRTQSGNAIANALPTPIDHQGMMLSPSQRHLPDYSQGPSVLQGSPRHETLQSAQEYTDMMNRSNAGISSSYPPGPPMSAGARMEGYSTGLDYGHPQPPHSAQPYSLMHQHSPDGRYHGQHSPTNSPLQAQQQHHLQQHLHGSDYRGSSYDDHRPYDYTPGPPSAPYLSHQAAAQDEYLAHHSQPQAAPQHRR
ncbi:SRF-TF-domain-containing protein [Meredithblackwellia eburnea MCA 4105]